MSSHRVCSYPGTAPPSPYLQVDTGLSAWLGSDNEKRSFDFFLSRASQRLGGYFNDSFWSREILQAAINYPSIRHLVVALGAAYEQFETHEPDEHLEDMRFALQQCNHSIRHLANSSSQSAEDMYTLLTSSVLFATFASLQSHIPEAIEHVRSGMRVLRNIDALKVHIAFPVPISRLRSILTSLYAQARSMMTEEVNANWEGQDPLCSDVKPVEYYLKLTDAQIFVETLFNNVLAFVQCTESDPPLTSKTKEAVLKQRLGLQEALLSSCKALDLLMVQQPGLDDKSLAILHVYHKLLAIRLGLDTKPSRESSYDHFEENLVQMLEHCRVILHGKVGSEDGDTSMRVQYSSGLGVVMPLHMIAARCRNPTVRQEAVNLLLKARRREWLWDSMVVAKIVSTTIEIEQEGSEALWIGNFVNGEDMSLSNSQTVPDEARVREVKFHFKGDRSANVDFVTVRQWRNGENGHRRFIEW